MKKYKIGYTDGVYDMFHVGHLNMIEEAKKHCDYLIVALHCCPDYKSTVQSIYERFMQLRAVKWVDEVIPYENKEDAAILLQSLDYDVYFLGEDYKGKDWENSDLIKTLNKEIFFLSRKHTFSSTNLKIRIVDKEMNIDA